VVGRRFVVGEIEGHPPGNVLLGGLLMHADDPVDAIDALADAMSIVGRVFPARPCWPPTSSSSVPVLSTRVLAALVPDIRDALRVASARVLYVANLSTQQAETSCYTVADHLGALIRHGVVPSAVLVDEDAAEGEAVTGVDLIRASIRFSVGPLTTSARWPVRWRGTQPLPCPRVMTRFTDQEP